MGRSLREREWRVNCYHPHDVLGKPLKFNADESGKFVEWSVRSYNNFDGFVKSPDKLSFRAPPRDKLRDKYFMRNMLKR